MSLAIACWLIVEHYYIYFYIEKVKNMDDTVGTNISNKVGLGGGFFTLMYGWLSDTNTAVFLGVVVTIVGFLMSLYFQRKKDIREKNESKTRHRLLLEEAQRNKELHEERMNRIRNGQRDVDEYS